MANRSRNAFFVAFGLAALVTVIWLVWGPRQAASTSPPFVSPFSPTVTPSPAPPAGLVVSAAAAGVTPTPVPTPEIEVAIVRLAVRDYRAAFGANPVGNNAEVTRALLGDNMKKASFLDRAEIKLNADGELLDRWGRPYFFHALTGMAMEVRSAGPDGQMFTPDDVVSD